MADFTMCKGDNCPQKEKCYRYTAIPSPYRQSYYFEIHPVDCESFRSNKGKHNNE